MLNNINQKLDYLFSKINWKDSHLDAKAIEIMNNLKSEIPNKWFVKLSKLNN